ncbi:MAG: hypothetical protein EON60_07310 [Alphaproteobacteria bacterium]|nr:MAG: hypothetical protein EON60_07310 [Alphaproteobacteria bacterium]
MPKSSHSETLPDETYSLAALLPTINRQWENETGSPQWLGWFTNHLLARIYLSYRTTSHPLAVEQLKQAETALASAFQDKNPDHIRYELWDLLLTKTVPAILKKAEPMPELGKVLAEAAKLRLRKERNERVTSQQWNDLDEDIQQVQELITESSDRKDPASRRDYYRMLSYLIGIARSAAVKNTHTSLANALRDTINALEIFHEPPVPKTKKDASSKPKPKKSGRRKHRRTPRKSVVSSSYVAETIITRFQQL